MSSLISRLAIAFDVGTTTIAGSIIDGSTGMRLRAVGSLNPQRRYGADVVARLHAACESIADRLLMQRLLNVELERLSRDLLHAARVDAGEPVWIAIAGNPAMEHLLLGLPVDSIAYPPYRPLFAAGKELSTTELGWSCDFPAYLFPLPGGFVGGDLVAFLHGCNSSVGTRLFLDIGTNGEIALSTDEAIYATSVAAGPTFEGGGLSCGVPAVKGAISGVKFDGDRVELLTLAGGRPQGLCGSGAIEALAALLDCGMVDPTGYLLPASGTGSNLANRLEDVDGMRRFVLYRDAGTTIFLSQQDIRQIQLAVAAVRAGTQVLFTKSRVRHESVQEVVVTGSFGTSLAPGALKTVGFLPEEMIEKTGFISEGTLAGVEKALISSGSFAEIERLAQKIRVIPLSGTPMFENLFMQNMNFPVPGT